MHDPIAWSRLDAAAYRVSMMRSLRWFAWYGALVGAAVLACGLVAPFVPLVVTGSLLVGAVSWNLCRPAVAGIAVDGIAMILVGGVQCVAWLWLEEAGPAIVSMWVLAGAFQIVWGIRRLALYRKARFAPNDPTAIARLESMVKRLSARIAKSDPTVAEFRTDRIGNQRCRLGLYADGAIALLEHQAVRLETRAGISIEARGTTSLGRAIQVDVQMSDLRLTGEMPVVDFERFERWQVGMSQERSLAA